MGWTSESFAGCLDQYAVFAVQLTSINALKQMTAADSHVAKAVSQLSNSPLLGLEIGGGFQKAVCNVVGYRRFGCEVNAVCHLEQSRW